MYAAAKEATKLPSDEKLAFCYDMLNAVSRRWGRCRRAAAAADDDAYAISGAAGHPAAAMPAS